MRSHIITPEPEPDAPPPRPRRLTVVGGYFPPPRPGQPAVVLVGVSGPVQGKQFSVDKALFRIGSSPHNELNVAADEYVSAHHASLIYNTGSLLLSDQHSRNGTFLNDQRVTDTPVTVRLNDLIRVGNSTLRVTTAAG
jgi:pSer/pThr/pTyr-binding forkhead associated (FHA) protein